MISGMSKLQVYSNPECTDLLSIDEEGKFINNIQMLASNYQYPYEITLYIRNDGSKNAYDLSINVGSTTVPNSNVTLIGNTSIIKPYEIVKAVIKFNVYLNQEFNGEVYFRLTYNNV